jgi:hypothetical protein
MRRPRTLGLGVRLATRGGLVTIGLATAAFGAVVAAILAVALRRRGAEGADGARALIGAASVVIAWLAGATVAFGASLRAFHRDRDEGVLALIRARGGTLGEYLGGRIGGLVLVLAVSLGGATLVAALAAVSATGPTPGAARAFAAAIAYVLAFSATVGPVAMAALGGASRGGGYLSLLGVLVLPELLSPWTAGLLPSGWTELTSIPAALGAVRAGIAAPASHPGSLARALAALAAVVAVSLAWAAARARQAEAAEGG